MNWAACSLARYEYWDLGFYMGVWASVGIVWDWDMKGREGSDRHLLRSHFAASVFLYWLSNLHGTLHRVS
jgi:hypothetical protein